MEIMSEAISVLLVDDHSLVRRGFRRILEDEEGMQIVGEASNGVEAIRLASELKPKVVVMDLSMPELDMPRIIMCAMLWMRVRKVIY